VVLAQETSGRLEPFLDRAAVLQIGLQRQIQQRLAGGADGRELGFLAPGGDLGRALLDPVQERDSLQNIRRGDLFQDAELLLGCAAVELEAGLQSGLAVGAEPIVSQAMAAGRIHRCDELESVERLAAGVHLLEDEADGLVGGVGPSAITGNW
jgi:hypothetical protein